MRSLRVLADKTKYIFKTLLPLRAIDLMLREYEARVQSRSVTDEHHIKMSKELGERFDDFIKSLEAQWLDPPKKQKLSIEDWVIIDREYRGFLKYINSDKFFNADIPITLQDAISGECII